MVTCILPKSNIAIYNIQDNIFPIKDLFYEEESGVGGGGGGSGKGGGGILYGIF